jgi:hypothetical protein
MADASGDAVKPGATVGTALAGPPTCGDVGPVLARRIAVTLYPLSARTIRPPADPALLRRVLDGLKQL